MNALRVPDPRACLSFIHAAALALVVLLAGSWFSAVYAAVPEGVTTALTDAKTDGVSIAGIVLGVIIAIAAFKYIRKAL